MMFENLFADNDFFQGGFVLMLIGAIIAAIRYAPVLIWEFIQRRWAVTVTTRDMNLIRWIGFWMAESEYGERCQWLDAYTIHNNDGIDAVLMPGIGFHSFKENGTRYWVDHSLEDQGVAGLKQKLTIKITGRDDEPLRQVIDYAVEMANMEHRDKNVVYINDKWGNWERVRLFPKRPFESLFLQDGLMGNIMDDANEFLDNHEWYSNRGLPYRRGYLFWGPAGNGKSTIIQVLSTELSLPIYLLSLSDADMTDYGLARALGGAPDKCLIVIEDFEKIDLDKTSMTKSGLLNAIDGPLASEGRLLVVTANAIDNIEDYFLRPGRIDRQWLIDKPNKQTIGVCYDRFSPDGAIDQQAFLQEAVVKEWSMAKVQQELVIRIDKPNTKEFADLVVE